MDQAIKEKIIAIQRNELTEHFIYHRLATIIKEPDNKAVLENISQDELRHAQIWQNITNAELKPSKLKIWFYVLIARLFGITFGIKLMEKGEGEAGINYRELAQTLPETTQIAEEEDDHENQLISMLNEERLNYVGSVIRGLNDALVELTGALAGFTFALQNTRLIAMVGLITGIAASLSMAGTEYLATKSEKGVREPVKSAVYTGIAYVITVIFLIFPYLVFNNVYFSLALMVCNAVLIILIFNFYTSVAQDEPFKKKFSEMAILSLGIATLSFGIGYAVRFIWHIDI